MVWLEPNKKEGGGLMRPRIVKGKNVDVQEESLAEVSLAIETILGFSLVRENEEESVRFVIRANPKKGSRGRSIYVSDWRESVIGQARQVAKLRPRSRRSGDAAQEISALERDLIRKVNSPAYVLGGVKPHYRPGPRHRKIPVFFLFLPGNNQEQRIKENKGSVALLAETRMPGRWAEVGGQALLAFVSGLLPCSYQKIQEEKGSFEVEEGRTASVALSLTSDDNPLCLMYEDYRPGGRIRVTLSSKREEKEL